MKVTGSLGHVHTNSLNVRVDAKNQLKETLLKELCALPLMTSFRKCLLHGAIESLTCILVASSVL